MTTMLRNVVTIFRDIIGGDSRRIELVIAPESVPPEPISSWATRAGSGRC